MNIDCRYIIFGNQLVGEDSHSKAFSSSNSFGEPNPSDWPIRLGSEFCFKPLKVSLTTMM